MRYGEAEVGNGASTDHVNAWVAYTMENPNLGGTEAMVACTFRITTIKLKCFSLPVFIDYGLSRDFIVSDSKLVVSKNVWIYSNVKLQR